MVKNILTDLSRQIVWRSSQIWVYTVCHSVYIFWTHLCMIKPHHSNFRLTTTAFSVIRIFQIVSARYFFITAGMSLQDLYQRCRESFLVNSDLTLQAQLTEFRDHKMIKSKKVCNCNVHTDTGPGKQCWWSSLYCLLSCLHFFEALLYG